MKKLILPLVILAAACVSEKTFENITSIKAVDPPIIKLDLKPISYLISNTKDTTLYFDTGTQIHIRKNTFVDANGITLTKDVEIQYREFHNPADILLSGITMKYKDDTKEGNFTSAGMFEFTANCEGNEAYIGQGCSVEIDMASYIEGDDYEFFHLEDQQANWNLLGSAKPKKNKQKFEKLKKLVEPILPIKPLKLKKGDEILDINVDYGMFPEFKSFYDVFWKYEHVSDEYDIRGNEELQNITWENIDISNYNENCYLLKLQKDSLTCETTVVPGYYGSRYDAKLKNFEEKMTTYGKVKDRVKKMREKAQTEADLLRTFEIQQTGIFNWDKIKNMINHVIRKVSFKTEEGIAINDVFYMEEGLNGTIRYSKGEFNLFKVNKKDKCKVFAIIGKDEYAEVNDAGLKAIVGMNPKEEHTIVMHTIGEKLNSRKEMVEYLNTL